MLFDIITSISDAGEEIIDLDLEYGKDSREEKNERYRRNYLGVYHRNVGYGHYRIFGVILFELCKSESRKRTYEGGNNGGRYRKDQRIGESRADRAVSVCEKALVPFGGKACEHACAFR